MLEQVSNSVRFAAHFVASGVSATGLTVTVDVYNSAGAEVVTAGSATELGDGIYYYDLSAGSTGSAGEYYAIFKTSGTADQQHIAAVWTIGRAGVEHLDADISDTADAVWDEALAEHSTAGTAGKRLTDTATTTDVDALPIPSEIADAVWDEPVSGHTTIGTTGNALDDAQGSGDPLTNTVPDDYEHGTAGYALGRIGAGLAVVSAPVTTASDITLTRGDDYSSDDSREISWVAGSEWPALTSATVVLKTNPATTDLDGAVVTATGGNKEVTVEPDAAWTSALGVGQYRYELKATLSSGNVVTLARGQINVEDIES